MTTHCTPSRATAIESADSQAFLMKPPGSCARQPVSGEVEVAAEVKEVEVVAVAVAARHLQGGASRQRLVELAERVRLHRRQVVRREQQPETLLQQLRLVAFIECLHRAS